jgi:alanine dehydrogenase
VFKSQVLVKIAPPTSEEIDLMQPEQILISPLQLPVLKDDYLGKIEEAKRITALAMEYLQSEDGSYPIVRIMSEIAGMSAVLTAAEYLNNTREGGRGLLIGWCFRRTSCKDRHIRCGSSSRIRYKSCVKSRVHPSGYLTIILQN